MSFFHGDNDKINILAKYLITKGVDEAAKIQKLLFMFRYEELINQVDQNDSYFEVNHNFEAWIYGPVNVKSYAYVRPLWYGDEVEPFLLDAKQLALVDQKYGKWFKKWNRYSSDELIKISQTNQAYLNARAGFEEMQPCCNYLDESDQAILEMNLKVND